MLLREIGERGYAAGVSQLRAWLAPPRKALTLSEPAEMPSVEDIRIDIMRKAMNISVTWSVSAAFELAA